MLNWIKFTLIILTNIGIIGSTFAAIESFRFPDAPLALVCGGAIVIFISVQLWAVTQE